jgi:tRNA-splicing endonuclease subunit Sen2
MADATIAPAPPEGNKPEGPPKPRQPSRAQQLNKLYSLPAPLRTFPLPTFVPHNPLSLFQILFVWVSQTIKPQSSHFDPLYQGWFSPDTRSVHVTDARCIRGLWEQGFYGKGSLSRSEPAWLDGEKLRRGNKGKITSEEVTRKRRAERQQTKWERARKEREAIDQKLLEEAEAAVRQNSRIDADFLGRSMIALVDKVEGKIENGHPILHSKGIAPVGPLELLALPNSNSDLERHYNSETITCHIEDFDQSFVDRFYAPPVGPLELLALPNSITTYMLDPPCSSVLGNNGSESLHMDRDTDHKVQKEPTMNGHVKVDEVEILGGSETNEETADESTHSEGSTETNGTPLDGSALTNGRPTTPKMKRQKSVRFSPTVEKNTFIQSEPPSPERASASTTTVVEEPVEEPLAIKEQEHLQVTLEEAFFLSYALGALTIFDPETRSSIPNEDLFYLFRKTSYFPSQANPSLSPDDPFMVNYIVYHHFRSLGWVVRAGIKFSCDYMLYLRGPVFSHAEFGVVIIPSYSDPYWRGDVFLQNYVSGKETRTWAWMNCINRVIGQVKKTLVLCYVDIPKPLNAVEEQKLGIDGILARYKVREVVMKRFVANRMRD